MSTTDDTQAPDVPVNIDELDLSDFDVQLIVPVRSTDPIDAVDTLLQECVDYGMRNYIYRVTDRESEAVFFVGPQGLLSRTDVDAIVAAQDAGEGQD